MTAPRVDVLTVTPNPALDWTLAVSGFTTGAVNRAESHGVRVGGKGVNVAAALTAWGCRTAATGFLGRENAAAFEGNFARHGIEDRFVRVAGETRVGVKLFDPASGESTGINLPGAAPSDADLEALFEAATADDTGLVVLAGSLPAGTPPAFYHALIRRLRERGCRTILDTSGDALHAAIDAPPHVVKPNVGELEALVGVRLSSLDGIVDAARSLIEAGIEVVAISMSGDGALFVDRENAVLAVPPVVAVASTVGAGDGMVAGIAAGMLEQRPLAGLAVLGTAFALAVLTRGAGEVSREAILAFEDEVELRAVNGAR